jgi:UDP-GlcNAc:undecaprenyl-phosphate GlcNAc-1-phosphate transferase
VAVFHVFIYGAGQVGELLLREILNNKTLHINPVGFLDDDPLKIGKKIQGYPILGKLDQLPELTERHGIKGVLLSFNGKVNEKAYRTAVRYCRDNDLFLKKFAIQLEPVDLTGKM